MIFAAAVVVAVVLLWLGHRRSRRLSGKRDISYSIAPIPGRLKQPRRGNRL